MASGVKTTKWAELLLPEVRLARTGKEKVAKIDIKVIIVCNYLGTGCSARVTGSNVYRHRSEFINFIIIMAMFNLDLGFRLIIKMGLDTTAHPPTTDFSNRYRLRTRLRFEM